MKAKPTIHGLMAEFLNAAEILSATRRAGRPATATWTPTRRTRSKVWRPSWAWAARASRSWCSWADLWCGRGVPHAVLFHGDQLHVQFRGPALQ